MLQRSYIYNVDVLYLEDENVHRLKNKTATMFFLKKPFSSYTYHHGVIWLNVVNFECKHFLPYKHKESTKIVKW